MNTQAKNIIYTGVAGTGKTYRLQQLAKKYSEVVTPIDSAQLLATLVNPLNWREVICLVFLQKRADGQELLKVGEIVEHSIFQAKASQNDRENNLKQSAWGTLQQYSPTDSKTVNYKNKASQAYFDKDETSSWYLLDEALPLLTDLQNLLDDYHKSSQSVQQAQTNQQIKARYSMVSFHQAYGYDEFVEGIRPVIDNQTGQMRYEVQAGAFLRLCQQAEQNPNHRHAMLIDEINRANVSQVFGELMSLIEPSKRAGQANAMRVNLAYSGQSFSVPSNVDIYATMNTQDHSLTALDGAFRRRFEFVEILPDGSELGQVADANGQLIDLGKLLAGLNNRIVQTLGEQARLGQAYFYEVKTVTDLIKVMARQIMPQILTNASHQPQALVAIFGLENGLTPWLVPLVSQATQSESAMASIGGFNGLSGVNQSSYQINPNLLAVVDGNVAESDFAMAEVFAGLY